MTPVADRQAAPTPNVAEYTSFRTLVYVPSVLNVIDPDALETARAMVIEQAPCWATVAAPLQQMESSFHVPVMPPPHAATDRHVLPLDEVPPQAKHAATAANAKVFPHIRPRVRERPGTTQRKRVDWLVRRRSLPAREEVAAQLH